MIVAFRVVAAPQTYPASWEDVSGVNVDAAFKWACGLADGVGRARLRAARVMVPAHQGLWAEARERVKQLPDVDDGRHVRAFIAEERPR